MSAALTVMGDPRPASEPLVHLRTAEALRAAFDAHGSLVHGFCRKAVGDDDAADLTQEVFLAAWRFRSRFDPDRGSLAGWLIGIARNQVLDHLRRGRRRPRIAGEINDEIDLVDRFEHVEVLAEQLLVGEALSSLTDRSRTAVEMAFWGGLSHAEIAERTGIPLGTVKSDIRRALIRLREHLEGADVGRTG